MNAVILDSQTLLLHFRYTPQLLLHSPLSRDEMRMELGERLRSISQQLERPPASVSEITFGAMWTFRAIEDALNYFVTEGKARGANLVTLTYWLPRLRDQVNSALREIASDSKVDQVLQSISTIHSKRAARWKGKGARGLTLGAPRTQLVLRLFDYMESIQDNWYHLIVSDSSISEARRDELKANLHERVRQVIDPPASAGGMPIVATVIQDREAIANRGWRLLR